MAWLLLYYPWVFLLSVAHVGRLVGVHVGDILGSIRGPAGAGLLMWCSVVTANNFLMHGQGSDVLRLVELVTVGATVYVGGMLILDRVVMREAAQLLSVFMVRSFGARTIAVLGPRHAATGAQLKREGEM